MGKTAIEAVFPEDGRIGDGSCLVPEDHRPYPSSAPMIFFGHYAVMNDHPEPLTENIACLDYGMGKGGRLVAYRWDGEARIDPGKFMNTEQTDKNE